MNRLDLLKSVPGGRGRWTEAVAYEASMSAAKLPPLLALPSDGWLDEPIEITDTADVRKIAQNGRYHVTPGTTATITVRRAVFGGTDDRPLKHLGEAQTCYVIKDWAVLRGILVDLRRHPGHPVRQVPGHHHNRDDRRLPHRRRLRGHRCCRGVCPMDSMADSDRYLRLPASAEELRR